MIYLHNFLFFQPQLSSQYTGAFLSLNSNDMAKYIFDTEIAKIVGTNAATVLENLVFWQKKNKENSKNLHDGKFWVYNSIESWKELQPHLSTSQLRTAIGRLIEKDLIYVGSYNEAAYDRTKWYSVNLEKHKSICEKCQIHLLKMTNQFAKNDKPIPVSKPIVNQLVKEKVYKKKYGELDNVLLSEDQLSKLKEKFPDYSARIERLSLYIAQSGKKYKNHYATILAWYARENKGKPDSIREVKFDDSKLGVKDDSLPF